MLVLSRRVGETLQIGENVTLTVLSVSGRQVRIGVTAPQSVPVVRSELREEGDAEPSRDSPGS